MDAVALKHLRNLYGGTKARMTLVTPLFTPQERFLSMFEIKSEIKSEKIIY